jgi:hypothetical protein
LFSDPNAGVSYTQPFNLAGETQFGFINIQRTGFQYHGDFVVSAVSIKPVPIFTFRGFFSPVDNNPVVNNLKAGAAVPVKFSLGGNQGRDIFQDGFPASQTVGCDNYAMLASVEETVSAGQSGLTYDAYIDQYTYVWKTQKSWENTCRQFVLRLADGSFHVANFKFK